MTLEEIKNEWSQRLNNGHGNCCKNWKEYVSNNDIDEEDITEIAERYAQSKTQELIEQNAELVYLFKRLIDNRMMSVIADIEAKELLTKYNHLNKKP